MMRKALILTTALAGIGALVAVAQASQHGGPEKDSSQAIAQTQSEDGERLDGPRDERSREARERYREERGESREEADEDQD